MPGIDDDLCADIHKGNDTVGGNFVGNLMMAARRRSRRRMLTDKARTNTLVIKYFESVDSGARLELYLE